MREKKKRLPWKLKKKLKKQGIFSYLIWKIAPKIRAMLEFKSRRCLDSLTADGATKIIHQDDIIA